MEQHLSISFSLILLTSAATKRITRQRGKQIPDFVLHLAGAGNGVRDFGAEHFAVALAQAMHRHFTAPSLVPSCAAMSA